MLQLTTESTRLNSNWQRWIAANLLLDVSLDEITNTLMQRGLSREAAEREIHAVARHPFLAAGSALAARREKAEAILGVLDDLARQSPRFGTIERRSDVSRDEFLAEYYSANRPVVLTGLMKTWPAMKTWSPDYLQSCFGSAEIEVTTNRDADPDYEVNLPRHRHRMTLSEYVDMVKASGVTNDHYVVARNHLFEKEGLSELLADIDMFPQLLDSNDASGKVSLWFGPAGTITPLHHDFWNILLAQVHGRKRVRLVPPTQLRLVYLRNNVYSEVDCEAPDFDRHPLFARATVMDVTLHPGEVLFLPVGWWHDVRSLDVSISISFSNFVFPNEYAWVAQP